jgi:PIN domain nuclease of toxin-antitoxin system
LECAEVIVLDTHALVWWASGDAQLSGPARRAIAAELKASDGRILVSSISAWEIALLIQKGRLVLSMNVDDWLQTVAEIDAIAFVSVDTDIALQSTRLPGKFHADPADRMIVALARHHAVPLLTADKKIRAYRHVKTVW